MSALHEAKPWGIRGRLVLPDGVLPDGVVVVEGDTITWVGTTDDLPDVPALATVTTGSTWPVVLPGLVDLHCHGGGGSSFPDVDGAASAMRAVLEHRRHGTTTLVASLVTAPRATLLRQAAVLAGLAEQGEVAGVHLEGPFIAPARCGAQDPRHIQEPDTALVDDLARVLGPHLVSMTLAPERDGVLGADGVATRLARVGALPSWGHTDAGPDVARRALMEAATELSRAGARSRRSTVTHLFNGMPPWHHRDPGPVGEFLAGAVRGLAVLELVADGVHLDPAVAREVVETVGRDAVVLVTDAMGAAGCPDGSYRLGGLDVTVDGGVARLDGTGALAGGTCHLLDVVRAVAASGVALEDAVAMAATGPARVLGDPTIGALLPGRRADLVVADSDLTPVAVLRRGRWC